jgi:hypothetical protein
MKDVVTGTVKVANGTATISGDPEDGVVNYTVKSTDFDTVGTYHASLILTKTGDQEETEHFTIIIQDSAGS